MKKENNSNNSDIVTIAGIEVSMSELYTHARRGVLRALRELNSNNPLLDDLVQMGVVEGLRIAERLETKVARLLYSEVYVASRFGALEWKRRFTRPMKGVHLRGKPLPSPVEEDDTRNYEQDQHDVITASLGDPKGAGFSLWNSPGAPPPIDPDMLPKSEPVDVEEKVDWQTAMREPGLTPREVIGITDVQTIDWGEVFLQAGLTIEEAMGVLDAGTGPTRKDSYAVASGRWEFSPLRNLRMLTLCDLPVSASSSDIDKVVGDVGIEDAVAPIARFYSLSRPVRSKFATRGLEKLRAFLLCAGIGATTA